MTGVDKIAVMTERHSSPHMMYHDRLDIVGIHSSGGRVAHMSYGDIPRTKVLKSLS